MALQLGGVAAEYRHKQFDLGGLRALAAVAFPGAGSVLAADAVAAHAQAQLEGFLQVPEQAVAGAQGEAAAGGYRLGQGAQVFLLGKAPLHGFGRLQLDGEFAAVEGVRGGGQAQGGEGGE